MLLKGDVQNLTCLVAWAPRPLPGFQAWKGARTGVQWRRGSNRTFDDIVLFEMAMLQLICTYAAKKGVSGPSA